VVSQQAVSRHKPWKVLASTPVYRADPWLAVERQKIELSDGRIVDDYHRITLPDFAGIVAQDEDGRFLVTRQYRHGVGRVCLTLPGGALDPGEAALDAAKRELREETGYEAAHWKALGSFAVNANYGCGTAHFFAATGARQTTALNSDDLEDTELLLLSRQELGAALERGEFAAVAAVAAILLATR
jgi:ADP-ribose pyrophosphatase